jgi:O-antigen/teichoic acid export membrane protein
MSLGRHSAYNLAGSLIPLAVSLVTVPLYLHLIGAERYGMLALAWLLLGYFGLFDLGLSKATAQRIAALKRSSAEERASTFWSALVINIGTGIVGGLVLFFAADFLFEHVLKVDEGVRGEMVAAVPFLAATIPMSTVGGVVSGAMQGRERFLEVNVVSIFSTVLTQLLPLGAAWLIGPSLTGLLAAALAARLLAVAVLAILCHTDLTRHVSAGIDRRAMLSLLSFGGWVTVSAFVGPMMIILDRFIIGALLGAVAVTLYTVPFSLAQRLMLIPAALQAAIFPRQAAASRADQDALTVTGVRAVAAVNTPIVLAAIFCIEPFLQLWLGSNFHQDSAEIGRITLLGVWSTGMATVPFSQIEARGGAKWGAIVHLMELPVYLIVLYFSMQVFGLVGAALAFSLRCAIDMFILSHIALKRAANWPMLVALGLVLCAAAFVAGRVSSFSLEWAVAGLAFLTFGTGLSYTYAPPPIRSIVTSVLERTGASAKQLRRR